MAMAGRAGTKPVRHKMKLRKGDTVRVRAGKDKGKQGEIIDVLSKKGKVIVQNINIAKKAVRPDPRKNPQGGIIDTPMPMDASNVQLICPRCNKLTRTTRNKDAEGKTSRKCKKCGELIDG